MKYLQHFREIWCVDFEFNGQTGEGPSPVCLVAREFRTGRLIRLWQEKFRRMPRPPFSTEPDTLFVAYYAAAELGCFLALNWPMPSRILDLCCEFKRKTSGLEVPCGRGLLGALTYYGLDCIDATEKKTMRERILSGEPFTSDERRDILDYCQTDVDALSRLLPVMIAEIDLPRALLRGRYMAAVARMERNGVPIDTDTLEVFKDKWSTIKGELISRIDKDYGIFEGQTFKADRWAAWLATNGISWPQLPSGQLALDDDTFREMARTYPPRSARARAADRAVAASA
jgi:DNA polymerase-1